MPGRGRRWGGRAHVALSFALAAALAAGGLLVSTAGKANSASGVAEVAPVPSQTIANIGASGAWWVNDLAKFSSAAQAQVAEALFGTSGLALSAYRFNIGGGGTGVSTPARAPQTFQTSPGNYDWSRDTGGQTFLRYASQYGVPDLVGFVNSAPAAWTTNGKSCGGNLTSGTEGAFATYLADIVAHFAGEGIRLNYLSPMNEPTNSFDSCGQEGMLVDTGQRDEVVRAVGQTLAARGLDSRVIADESTSLSAFNSQVPQWMAVSGTAQYVNALAHHTYDFPTDAALTAGGNVGRQFGKPLWGTEICCFTGVGAGYGQQYDPTITGGLAMSDIIYRDFTVANDSAFHWWVALSSELGCSPTTSASCATSANSNGWNDGLIYYDPNYASNGNQSLYLTKRYYALGQYSRYVRPGAVRYNVTGAPSGVEVAAFDRNGTWTLVVNNLNTAATALNVHLNVRNNVTATTAVRTSASENLASVALPAVGSGTVSATLPARSITTYVLRQDGGGTSTLSSPLVGQASGKCLDVPGSSQTNGTQVEIFTCNGETNQQWTYTAAGELRVYGTKCLEAYQQGTADGTKAAIFDCNGGANQQWSTNSNGTIIGQQSGKCLDVSGAGTANGALAILYTCNDGTNQAWQRP